jgi:hypothetical protein
MTLLQLSTSDDGRLSPVRVSAPNLAASLDRWALQQLALLPLPPGPVALRLQPGGTLTNALADDVAALLARRPELALVLQVPEQRLEEAIAADRAVLGWLTAAGVGLGVSGWSGRIDVRALTRSGVGLVELAPACQQAVTEPDGTALLTGLVAGLRAGLGRQPFVVAGDPDEILPTSGLEACGIVWAALSPARMMPDHDGEP